MVTPGNDSWTGNNRGGATERAQDAAEGAREEASAGVQHFKNAGREATEGAKDAAEEAGRGMSAETEGAQEQVTEGARDMAESATERAREMGEQDAERARELADSGLDQAAGTAERAAEAIRERTGAVPAVKVAASIERTAEYLRSHEPGDVLGDVEHYVREHPLQGAAAAVAVGFVIGRILR